MGAGTGDLISPPLNTSRGRNYDLPSLAAALRFHHARNDLLNALDGCFLRINIISDFLPAPQHDDPVYHLEHMVNVMSDEDARMSRVTRTSQEAQHALSFLDAQIVGWLVQDDQVAL